MCMYQLLYITMSYLSIYNPMLSYQKTYPQLKQGLSVSFKGDKEILPFLTLKLQATIILDKPFVACIPIIPIFPETQLKDNDKILQPLITIEVFGQSQKDFIMKNKNYLKEKTLYIYFPSNILVDERVNKIYLNSYENIVKEIPRSLRNNLTRLILYEQGQNENSIDQQKFKCSEALISILKKQLELKIKQYDGQLSKISSPDINYKLLFSLFKNNFHLAVLYRKIGLDEKSAQILMTLWQSLLFSQRHFVDHNNYMQETLYLPPFIQRNYQKIAKNFFTANSFLKITAFVFLKSFEAEIEMMNYCEAHNSLIKLIQFSSMNCFKQQKTKQELIRNLWIMSVIDETYEICVRLGRSHPTILNHQKEHQYNLLVILTAKMYRNSIEKIGLHLYSYNHLTSFPRTLEQEISECLKYLELSTQNAENYPTQELNLLSQRVEQNVLLIFSGVQGFKYFYLKSLINLYELLHRSSHHKRNARAVKLIVLKIYLSTVQPQHLIFSKTLISQYGNTSLDIQEYIEKIWNKAEKIALFDEQDGYISEVLFKRSLKYDLQKDNYINRNQEDECLWPQLKFIEDYYKFIILLISYRNSQKPESKEQNTNSFNFLDITHKIPIKTDNIIHLLLNKDLMRWPEQWQNTVKLVGQIFLIQRGEQNKPKDDGHISIRLGILLDAKIIENSTKSREILLLKLSNKQLINLSTLPSQNSIQILLQIIDINQDQKTIQLKLLKVRTYEDNLIEFQLQIIYEQCLIFIIKQFEVNIGHITCYYINKSLEIEEIKAIEEQQLKAKKRVRKYSSFEQKLKEEEFIYEINKSEKLIHNYLHYNTLYISSAHSQAPNNSQPKPTIFRDSESLTNSSIYNLLKDKKINIPLYIEIWNPITYHIKPSFVQPNMKITIPIKSISISGSQREQISDWVKIDEQWIYKSKGQEMVISVGGGGVRMMVMVLMRGQKKQKKQRKGSCVSRGGVSQNASWCSDLLRLQLQIIQNQYSYRLQNNISYSINKPFHIKYMYCEDLEEYSLQNLTKHTLNIHPFNSNSNQLLPNEEIALESSQISLIVNIPELQHPDIQQHHHLFTHQIDLNHYVKKELLKPKVVETCELEIVRREKGFKKLSVIMIRSDELGVLNVLSSGNGFEFVGKIQGEVCLDEQGVLDFYLLPVESGRLILPSLLIGNKKAIWKNENYIMVCQ